MTWITVALMAINAFLSMSNSGDGGRPELPGYIKPDMGPLTEQGLFARYQDKKRNELLGEYYGAKFPSGSGGRPTFTGDKPSSEYFDTQKGIIESSAADFSPELAEYMASRGIDSGDQVQGAQQELGKTYDQRAREISAKSHDIYALTLGSLFGEVSDVGMQGAQLVGQTTQANAMENARRDQSYNQAMQRWQYEQGRPNAASTIGGMLPMLAMMMGGGSGGYPTSYDAGSAGSGFNPGMANTSWINYGG